MSPRLQRALLVLVIAIASPAALGLDLIARHYVIGGQPAEVQAFFAEHVTRLLWLVTPGPLLGGALGFWLYPRAYRKALAKLRGPGADDARDPEAEQRADAQTLLLCTTCAQLPALLGDLGIMLGARMTPALIMTASAVLAVLAMGAFARPSTPR